VEMLRKAEPNAENDSASPAKGRYEYISSKVDPILLPMVTELVCKRPENPVQFMIEYLRRTENEQDASNKFGNLTRLNSEIGHLKSHIHMLEEKYGKLDTTDAKSDTSDDEDDDDDDICELPEIHTGHMLRPRNSVSAEAYGEWNKKNEHYTPPVYPKTPDQMTRLRNILSESFLFQSLDEKDLTSVINAMQERVLEKAHRIIQEGDDGDALFVVDSGAMDCYKTLPGYSEEMLVKSCYQGDAFGELALLYNCPRAASVQSRHSAILWQLDRETFNHIVKEAAAKKRERYERFLMSVPLLEAMDPYERSKIADVLKTETYQRGDYIVRQGDAGNKFYLIETGECFASKSYVSGQLPREVFHYKEGDYFGELALLNDAPRAASVIAKGTVKVASLDRRSFKRLLGPIEDILTRNTSRYEQTGL